MSEPERHEACGLLADEAGGLAQGRNAEVPAVRDVVEADVLHLAPVEPRADAHEGDRHVVVDEHEAVRTLAHHRADERLIRGVAAEQERIVRGKSALLQRVAHAVEPRVDGPDLLFVAHVHEAAAAARDEVLRLHVGGGSRTR